MGHATEYYELIRDDRQEWASWFPMCWNCRWLYGTIDRENLRISIETHEMIPRSKAPRSWGIRANYCRLCNTCHANVVTLSLAHQLALKKHLDPKHYDLVAIRELLDNGLSPIIIEEQQVNDELMALKEKWE